MMLGRKIYKTDYMDNSFFRLQKNNLRNMTRMFPHMPFMALPRAIEMSYISRHKMAQPILDLGCGDGCVSKTIFDNRNVLLFAGDISVKSVKLAQRTFIYKGLVAFDITAAPFTPDTFKSIYSVCVLEHIPHLNQLLSEVYRILQGGGIFQFTTLSDKFKELLYFPLKMNEHEKMLYLANLDKRLGHFRYFTPLQWTRELEKAGFVNIRCQYIFNERAVKLWNVLEHYFTKTIRGKKIYRHFYNTRGVGWVIRQAVWAKTLSSFLLPYLDPEETCGNARGGYLYVHAFKPVE